MHPSEKYWFRNSDLGNGVQQGEIVKAGRLLIGLDDLNPDSGLNVIPRLPATWKRIEVEDYPVVATDLQGKNVRTNIKYKLDRIENGYSFQIESADAIRMGQLRLGPFDTRQIVAKGGKMKSTVVELRGKYYLYLDISGLQGKKISLSAISKN